MAHREAAKIDICQAVDALRYALASIWTEIEKDSPSEEDVRQIVNEALEMTRHHTKAGKDLTLGETGLAGWDEYCKKWRLK